MTDPRFGNDLLAAIRRLPSGSGVIFRHYSLTQTERRRLYFQVRSVCRKRGHMLLLAGTERMAVRWRADGYHDRNGRRQSQLPRSAAVHDRDELREAIRNGADLLFISPLFETASHAGAKGLRRLAFNSLAKQAGKMPVVALGGMTRQRAQSLNRKLVHGWAAIDAFRKTRD